MKTKIYIRDWIVIKGDVSNLIQSSDNGGGFEFFGPFTQEEAMLITNSTYQDMRYGSFAVQLLKMPNLMGEHWNPTHTPQISEDVEI